MAGSWRSSRHVVVLLVAMVVAAYHMLQLEQRRAHRDVQADEEFDRAVVLLRTHLLHHHEYHGDYHVLIAQRHAPTSPSSQTTAATARGLTAFVVDRAPSVPRIEAELVVEITTIVNKPTKSFSRQTTSKSRMAPHIPSRHPKSSTLATPLLEFIVYNAEAMATAASLLEQRGLANVVRRGQPSE